MKKSFLELRIEPAAKPSNCMSPNLNGPSSNLACGNSFFSQDFRSENALIDLVLGDPGLFCTALLVVQSVSADSLGCI